MVPAEAERVLFQVAVVRPTREKRGSYDPGPEHERRIRHGTERSGNPQVTGPGLALR